MCKICGGYENFSFFKGFKRIDICIRCGSVESTLSL